MCFLGRLSLELYAPLGQELVRSQSANGFVMHKQTRDLGLQTNNNQIEK